MVNKMLFTPANLISMLRVAVGIGFLYTIYIKNNPVSLILLTIFILLDILDGYVARRFNCTSELGVILDHGTDKFFTVATVVLLFIKGDISPFIFWAFIFRDICFVIGWGIIRIKRKRVIKAQFYGKLAGGFYFLLIFIYLFNLDRVFYPFAYLTLLVYYISGMYYAKDVLLKEVSDARL